MLGSPIWLHALSHPHFFLSQTSFLSNPTVTQPQQTELWRSGVSSYTDRQHLQRAHHLQEQSDGMQCLVNFPWQQRGGLQPELSPGSETAGCTILKQHFSLLYFLLFLALIIQANFIYRMANHVGSWQFQTRLQVTCSQISKWMVLISENKEKCIKDSSVL